jgi:hypothetical protein
LEISELGSFQDDVGIGVKGAVDEIRNAFDAKIVQCGLYGYCEYEINKGFAVGEEVGFGDGLEDGRGAEDGMGALAEGEDYQT